uniref:Retrovirus-related Pol polyprotein from transposon TNT 1-94 n=1 Tax=Tanacetum cinerariifolium TaxID=118510 RepID=A0A6L2JJY6_TANCI|nr:retrovirus-related Pol polyprotein from transposon TNT 1-94 [Tanacetum cinerariifolium]
MGEEASCCGTSCIYQGEDDQSFSIRCFATFTSYRRVNRELKRLDRVLVAEFVEGEQFVTEEIIEEGNRWPNIKRSVKKEEPVLIQKIYFLEKKDQDGAHMVAASKVIENDNSLPKTHTVKGVKTVMPITSAEDMAKRRLEVKARSTLMMGIPNENQLKFNSIKDAKLLVEAIEKSIDDLYNNLKVYKPKVKGVSSSSTNTQNMAFVSSSSNNNTNSSNEAVNTAFGVTTIGTQSSTCNEDLEQIYLDDLEKIDLKWQMAMLTMRAKRFLKKTGRKLNLNRNETVAFDKTKVECYNCHKRGHFTRECRASRAQDNKNKESTRRNVPIETTNSLALVSCDGVGGYDWSDQAKEGPNYALMIYSTSSSDSEEFISKLAVETLNTKTSEEVPKVVKNDNGVPIIEDWKLDDEDESVPQPKIEKKTIKPNVAKVPRKKNMYSVDLKNIIPKGGLCHMGLGTKAHGEVGRIFWHCSGACRCTGRGVGEGVRFGGKTSWGYCLGSWSLEVWQVWPSRKLSIELPDDLNIPELEDISIFEDTNEDVFSAEADLNNLESTFQFSPIPTIRIHKDHPPEQVIRDLYLAPKTRRIAIGSKWVFKNKIDERRIVIRNKARLVAQGHTQEEGIDYHEFFAPVARIEAIRLFLAFASFKDFMVYQMDVKSTFLYVKIKEEVYVCQPLGFEYSDFPDKVYKVEKVLYGLNQAPRAWFETLSTYL